MAQWHLFKITKHHTHQIQCVIQRPYLVMLLRTKISPTFCTKGPLDSFFLLNDSTLKWDTGDDYMNKQKAFCSKRDRSGMLGSSRVQQVWNCEVKRSFLPTYVAQNTGRADRINLARLTTIAITHLWRSFSCPSLRVHRSVMFGAIFHTFCAFDVTIAIINHVRRRSMTFQGLQ